MDFNLKEMDMRLFRIFSYLRGDTLTMAIIEAKETARMYTFPKTRGTDFLGQVRKAEVDGPYGQFFTHEQKAIDAMVALQERDIVQALLDIESAKKVIDQLSRPLPVEK